MPRQLPNGIVTLVFTDVEGSTRLLHELGAENYGALLVEHRRVVRDAFGGLGGVEVDTQGDASFYAFADAGSAVAAARAANDVLAAGPIRIRIGLHTGTPKLTEEGYVGEVVHLGARIAAAGHGGQVLLSAATRRFINGGVTELGEHRLKDFTEPVAIFQLGEERFPPLKTISNTNLPRPASSFVGRERETAAVIARIRDHRLVTLSGPGGTGKTRLSLEAAAGLVGEFKAGVFWVGLATLREPTLVLETVGQTLGAKDGLAEHIGERELLLLLDNFEQVVDAAPELASLVEVCPNLHLLVTSRELLRVRGEVEYPVPPLAEPEAVALFCARAQLEPDEMIPELCSRLDNLPLAVELAAARTSVLTPAQILGRLTQRLDLLKGGRDAEARQLTLRATIEWSHDLLTEEEQQLFARLAVFSGGCSLEAAEQVTDAELDLLQSLVEKSLIRHSGDRFWMLETIREYAVERLDESGDGERLERRHLEYYVDFVERTRQEFHTPDERESINRLQGERDNIRKALGWSLGGSQVELGLRLGAALDHYWGEYGAAEGRRWLEAGLARSGGVSPSVRASALAAAGKAAFFDGDYVAGDALNAEALQLYRKIGDERGVANLLVGSSSSAVGRGDVVRASALAREGLAIAREIPDLAIAQHALLVLGEIAKRGGDIDTARQLLMECVSVGREIGSHAQSGAAMGGLGDLALEHGELDEATRCYREALELTRGLGPFSVGYALVCLAAAAAQAGDVERAGRLWGVFERLEEEEGLRLFAEDRNWYLRFIVTAEGSTFADASETGRHMDLDAAVTYALSDLGWASAWE